MIAAKHLSDKRVSPMALRHTFLPAKDRRLPLPSCSRPGAAESARRRLGAVAAAMAAFRRFGVRHFVPYRDLMPVVATGMPPFLRLLLCIIGIDRGDAARARPPRSISD